MASRDDPPERETVCGLGNGKDALFRELLAQKGVEVFDGSVAFIRRLRTTGLKTAVVSASKNTVPILKAAGLADLFDACVDGVEAARLGLKGKPSPDTFLHAAKLLGVPPGRAFGVEDSLAGVEAIRAAGFGLVIGVDRTGQGAALAAHGAGVVVPDLSGVQVRAKEAGDPARDASGARRGPSMRTARRAPGCAQRRPGVGPRGGGVHTDTGARGGVPVHGRERLYREPCCAGRGKLAVRAGDLHRWSLRYQARRLARARGLTGMGRISRSRWKGSPFGSISASSLSTAGSWICDRRSSGASGGTRTPPAASRAYAASGSPPPRTGICWSGPSRSLRRTSAA